MTGVTDHARYTNGRLRATPDCPCDHCRAVYEEWGEQAQGFQRWFDGLPDERLLNYFGLVRGVMPEFESQGSFEISGRGHVFTVRAGEYANRVDELLDHQVRVDGYVWTVTGVERFAIALPYPEHYSIGLLVRSSNAL